MAAELKLQRKAAQYWCGLGPYNIKMVKFYGEAELMSRALMSDLQFPGCLTFVIWGAQICPAYLIFLSQMGYTQTTPLADCHAPTYVMLWDRPHAAYILALTWTAGGMVKHSRAITDHLVCVSASVLSCHISNELFLMSDLWLTNHFWLMICNWKDLAFNVCSWDKALLMW